ncbi:MAG: recombinase family protein [Synergistaceae bacterium]|nr:recombinase family protein [Synergistaceae bacterium]
MAKVYGYARVSTQQQNIERQVRNILNENKDAVIVRETYTGKTLSRPEFEKLLKTIKPGDTLIFDSVSRMSRNAADGFKLYQDLYTRGVNLVFLNEHHIDTDTYKKELEKLISLEVRTGDGATDDLLKSILDALNKYILKLAEKQIYLAFAQAQKEVDDLRQRTREGIETARRNGKQIGGVAGSKLHVKKQEPIKELIKKHSKDFCGNLNDRDVLAIINNTPSLHLSRNTYYKYKREIVEE